MCCKPQQGSFAFALMEQRVAKCTDVTWKRFNSPLAAVEYASRHFPVTFEKVHLQSAVSMMQVHVHDGVVALADLVRNERYVNVFRHVCGVNELPLPCPHVDSAVCNRMMPLPGPFPAPVVHAPTPQDFGKKRTAAATALMKTAKTAPRMPARVVGLPDSPRKRLKHMQNESAAAAARRYDVRTMGGTSVTDVAEICFSTETWTAEVVLDLFRICAYPRLWKIHNVYRRQDVKLAACVFVQPDGQLTPVLELPFAVMYDLYAVDAKAFL